jgi:hypothetical protein
MDMSGHFEIQPFYTEEECPGTRWTRTWVEPSPGLKVVWRRETVACAKNLAL